MKSKMLFLSLILLIGVFLTSNLIYAKLPAAAKKTLSRVEKLAKNKKATNEEIIAELKNLQMYNDIKIVEKLIEKVIPHLDPEKNSERRAAFDVAIKTIMMMKGDEQTKYLESQIFNPKVPGKFRGKFLGKGQYFHCLPIDFP